ncbi:TerB family tellurite resistance protein [Aliiroseovarius sp. Z3]|uniref:tellurite resistance TerB family protein n=1 Tax=Aliiroseovarius sp. Z3 TaxID=2811402 RepID=UPI0023B228CB|nr:TerB family tellurite resistance protein [Aliiroseovarius sp. Z3]MDE9451826.1 TerB family tellurite resistance protein [Aliiroseovarius sp. Z3]
MIRSLLRKLSQPDPNPLGEDDARLAIAALLVRLARSDHAYGASEVAEITRILSHRYGLTPDSAAELRQKAEQLEAEAPDTVRFTNAVKDGVPLDDRIAVIEAAWSVVLADGVRTAEEDALMRMIPRFLGITDLQSNTARQRALQAINGGG